MDKGQIPSGYVATCSNLKIARDEILVRKKAQMRSYLDMFVVIKS